MWILFATIYALLIGFYTVLRKKASQKTNLLFVLAVSSSIGFLLVSWSAAEAVTLSWQYILFIFGKSIIVSQAWVFELIALKNYYISSLQPISAIKVVIAFIANMLIFNEQVVWWKFIGVVIIFVGLITLNQYDRKTLKNANNFNLNKIDLNKNIVKFENIGNENVYIEKSNKVSENVIVETDMQTLKKRRIKAIIFFIFSCIFNETSGILDKIILNHVSTNQMQFWFMLFVAIIIWIYFFVLCAKKRKMQVQKSDWKNYLMYIIPFILIIADRFLFTALSQPNVLVTGVSIIKQLSTIVAVIFGGLLYKEPNLKYKLIYLAIILVGIIIVLV